MSHQALFTGFFVALGVTVVFLGLALWLAHVHRPRGHIAAIAAFLLAFLCTLGFAESLGDGYTFDPLSYWVHIPIAAVTTLFAVAPLATGWSHWTGKGSLERHRTLARVFLLLVVLALGTGVWMLAAATRRPTELVAPGGPG
jgi:hypothetical protein